VFTFKAEVCECFESFFTSPNLSAQNQNVLPELDQIVPNPIELGVPVHRPWCMWDASLPDGVEGLLAAVGLRLLNSHLVARRLQL